MSAFATGLVVMALLLLLTHFLPWPVRLHRLAAYSIGVGAMLLGVWIWRGNDAVWRGLVVYAFVAGAATGLGYGIDAALRWVQALRIGQVDDGRPDA